MEKKHVELRYPADAEDETAAALRALLLAGRELGPTGDEALVARYIEERHPAPARPAYLLWPLAGRILLHPLLVPAEVLGWNLALTAGAMGLLSGYVDPLTRQGGDFQLAAGCLTIMFVANAALFGGLLAAQIGLRACGTVAWRATHRLHGALGAAMLTLAGTMVVDGLALAGASGGQVWWPSFLLIISAAACLFWLLAAGFGALGRRLLA